MSFNWNVYNWSLYRTCKAVVIGRDSDPQPCVWPLVGFITYDAFFYRRIWKLFQSTQEDPIYFICANEKCNFALYALHACPHIEGNYQETIHKFCITSLFAHAENWLFLWRKFFELIQKHKFILNRFFKGSARSFTFALSSRSLSRLRTHNSAPQRRLIISSKFPPPSAAVSTGDKEIPGARNICYCNRAPPHNNSPLQVSI